MAKERIRAEVKFVKDGAANLCRARLPAVVRDRLGARPGDALVIEEGCEQSVMRATLRKGNLPYFIITLERATEATPIPVVENVETSERMESLAEAVERKRREAREK